MYSHTITPRLQYSIDFLSGYFQHGFELIDTAEIFKASTEYKINYSDQPVSENELWLRPVPLLFEKTIAETSIQVVEHPYGYPAFFKTESETGFDLFAATFYLLSRYEEYLPHAKDRYGRYAHENSIAFKNGFLHLPLINLWLHGFRRLLAQKNFQFSIRNSPFTFQPTYDIDIAWSYRNKGLLRNAGGALRSIIKGDLSAVTRRLAVLAGQEKDPFDTYEWLDEIHRQYNLKPVYFFHAGQKRNRYDKNISTRNQEFQLLIKGISGKYRIGLHPSWHSGDQVEALHREKESLENIIGTPVYLSRQHYIRLALPHTYRLLINAGIKEEFSMGYGSINGFRASIASSFYWYDLKNEKSTELLLHPFCYMDGNSLYHQSQSPAEALKEMLEYCEILKMTGGNFISIWHNPFFGTDPIFHGWKEVYGQFIDHIQSQNPILL